jgi:hypothetical protein
MDKTMDYKVGDILKLRPSDFECVEATRTIVAINDSYIRVEICLEDGKVIFNSFPLRAFELIYEVIGGRKEIKKLKLKDLL